MAVRWDLVVRNGEEGVGAFDAFAFIGTGANAFAKVPKLVCIGGVPVMPMEITFMDNGGKHNSYYVNS